MGEKLRIGGHIFVPDDHVAEQGSHSERFSASELEEFGGDMLREGEGLFEVLSDFEGEGRAIDQDAHEQPLAKRHLLQVAVDV